MQPGMLRRSANQRKKKVINQLAKQGMEIFHTLFYPTLTGAKAPSSKVGVKHPLALDLFY